MVNGKRACWYPLLTTALLVGIYWLGQNIVLPGVNRSYFSSINKLTSGSSTVGIFFLRYSPFITGFLFVEILSLIIPAGRRMRSGGRNGRAKLNRAAMSISIVVCVFQSLGLALAMEISGAPGGIQLVPNPGWRFRFLTCLTLTVGAILVFYIARLISRKGIADGFCILIAYDILTSITGQLKLHIETFREAGSIHGLTYFACAAAVLLFLFACFRKTSVTRVAAAGSEGGVNLDIPVFPQGILPLVWAFYVFSLPSLIPGLPGRGPNEQLPGFWPLLSVITVLIVIFSAIGMVLFSSRKRIIHNLPPGLRLETGFERMLRNQTIRGAVVLAGGSVLLLALESQFGHGSMPNYANLIFLVAIALDAMEQWKFSRKRGRSEELIELDNAHLASYLQNLLKKNGIDSVVQTYRYRRLLFFLGPLTKMRLRVASDDSRRALELIDWKSLQII